MGNAADEPTDEYRAIGRARPPQPPPDETETVETHEAGWAEDPPMPVDTPIAMRERTTRVDKQRNQRR